MVCQLIPEDASEDSPAAYQNAVVKMLFTLSVSQTAFMLCMPNPNTRISVSSPQPSVIRCLSHISRMIKTNMAKNMISAKICAVICFPSILYIFFTGTKLFGSPVFPLLRPDYEYRERS